MRWNVFHLKRADTSNQLSHLHLIRLNWNFILFIYFRRNMMAEFHTESEYQKGMAEIQMLDKQVPLSSFIRE